MAPLSDRLKSKVAKPITQEVKPLKTSTSNGWKLDVWAVGQGTMTAPSGQVLEMRLDVKAGVSHIVTDPSVSFCHEACEKLHDMLLGVRS